MHIETPAMTRASATTTTTRTSAAAIGSTKCPKCGTVRKSGKLSCCARGGAWFEKCGGAGHSNFDHTWVEGVQACTHFDSLLPIEAPVQIMLLHEKTNTQPTNKTLLEQGFKQHADIYPTGNIFNTDTADSEDNDEVTNVVAFTSLFFIIVSVQM